MNGEIKKMINENIKKIDVIEDKDYTAKELYELSENYIVWYANFMFEICAEYDAFDKKLSKNVSGCRIYFVDPHDTGLFDDGRLFTNTKSCKKEIKKQLKEVSKNILTCLKEEKQKESLIKGNKI
jgi:hypothetical protein